jgi:hypothetical protein
MLIAAIVATAAAFSAPHDQSDWRDLIVTRDQVSYSGVLTPPVVQRIEASLQGRRKTLRIASSGGAVEAGLDLAEFISAHRIKVVANRFCFSACASYVLPASPWPTLDGPVLLGFHNTDSAMAAVMAARRSPRDAPLVARLEIQAKREQALYRKAGIDPALLYAPLADLKPLCSYVAGVAGREVAGVKTGPKTMWSPDAATLTRYGLRLQVGEAASLAAVRARYDESWARHLSSTDLFAATGPGYSAMTLARATAVLAAMPAC